MGGFFMRKARINQDGFTEMRILSLHILTLPKQILGFNFLYNEWL